MHPLDRIPELVRVHFPSHSSMPFGLRCKPTLPRLDLRRPATRGVADRLRGQQWMGSPLRRTLGQSGAARLIQVSAGRATRLLQMRR
jgi:hypothetical protein